MPATAGGLSWLKCLPLHRRWETPDGSIFSVADGRRLAQEPVRLPTAFEAARQRKIERATMETPLVRLHHAEKCAFVREQQSCQECVGRGAVQACEQLEQVMPHLVGCGQNNGGETAT